MKTLFVASSGTDIGKTYVCCRLIDRLNRRLRLRCLKPVVTGFDPTDPVSSDTARIIRAQGLSIDDVTIEATSPWRFRDAISADMASAREERPVPFDKLLEFCRPRNGFDLTLIEGIGGVMAPIDQTHTVLDWISALDTDVLLVVGSYLGSLSHTLTAVEALARSGRTPSAIIVSQSECEPVTTEETAGSLARHCHNIPIAILPRARSKSADASLKIIERLVLQ